ncbi:hypothetical protein HRbin12_01195 [bacterium HR12]|nr:hypothetical protein HRbin12_01195 [bacterium HR12]
MGDVRRPREQVRELAVDGLELGLQPLELGRARGGPGDQRLALLAGGAADRLRGAVALGPQLVHPRRERAATLVQGEDLVDHLAEPPPGEPAAEGLWILPDRADVEHYPTFSGCAAASRAGGAGARSGWGWSMML